MQNNCGPEVQELDNEISMLTHKLASLKEKDAVLLQEDERQREKFQKLRVAEYKLANKEAKMMEMAKKMYDIDFTDHQKVIAEAENEERKGEKQQMVKKIGIIKQAMEINKKNYQAQSKAVAKRRKDMEATKQALIESIGRLD